MNNDIKTCPTCSIRIEGDLALFSYGKPGSLERLYSRVCRHRREGTECINPNQTYVESEDYKPI